MKNTGGCPLCDEAVDGPEELRIHLMVDHRKSAVIDEYVEGVGRSAVAPF